MKLGVKFMHSRLKLFDSQLDLNEKWQVVIFKEKGLKTVELTYQVGIGFENRSSDVVDRGQQASTKDGCCYHQ